MSPGAVAAAASAANHFPHEIDLSNGVPSSVQFTLRTLRYFLGTLRGGGQDVVGASVRACNLDTKRSIYGPSESVLVALEYRGASVTSPSGAGLSGVTVLVVSRTQAASTGVGRLLAEGSGTGGTVSSGRSYRFRTQTGSGGRYEVSGLPPGATAIVAIRRGIRTPPSASMRPKDSPSLPTSSFPSDVGSIPFPLQSAVRRCGLRPPPNGSSVDRDRPLPREPTNERSK